MSPVQWHTPAERRDFCEFEASLGFLLSNRSTRSRMLVSPCLKTKENKPRKENVQAETRLVSSVVRMEVRTFTEPWQTLLFIYEHLFACPSIIYRLASYNVILGSEAVTQRVT